MRLTFNHRALYERELDKLQKSLEDLSLALAEEFGLKVSFSYTEEFPEKFNHKESNDKIRQISKKKGFQLLEMKEAFRGFEDFGHYTKLTKGAICFIGNGEVYPPIHTFGYDFRVDIIEVAVELFKVLA